MTGKPQPTESVLNAYDALESGYYHKPGWTSWSRKDGHDARVQTFVNAMNDAAPPEWVSEYKRRMGWGTCTWVQAFIGCYGWRTDG